MEGGKCRILRSEAWRQVRFYTDCLQFLNRNELPYPSAQKKFIEDLRLASQTADFLWGNILVQLPRSKRRNYVPGQDVLVLGEASIPNNVADLLRLGPKYCEHPDLDKTELLSLVRTAAGKASMDESDRCVREGVDCLPQRVKKVDARGRRRRRAAVVGVAVGRRRQQQGTVLVGASRDTSAELATKTRHWTRLNGTPRLVGPDGRVK
ncbi:hypothetical protein MRX96_020173 [Rhipicephalus microplus]